MEGNAQAFPTLEPKSVSCKQCQHFIPDQVGDGTGIGRCNNDTIKSKKSLFLNQENFCNEYQVSLTQPMLSTAHPSHRHKTAHQPSLPYHQTGRIIAGDSSPALTLPEHPSLPTVQ